MTTILLGSLPLRGQDKWGDGAYGTSRGSGKRKHEGIDIAAYPGTVITAVCPGKVTKIGYPYKNDLSFRYVQVSAFELDYRYFYLDPVEGLKVGMYLKAGDPLGAVQSLQVRYAGITDHVHLEIRQLGVFINPTRFITGGGT